MECDKLHVVALLYMVGLVVESSRGTEQGFFDFLSDLLSLLATFYQSEKGFGFSRSLLNMKSLKFDQKSPL